MSRKRQNNHYHYAEKFTDRGRRAKRFAMPLPRRAVFFALLILILFGTITVTFSTTNTGSAEDSTSNNGAILVRLRNQRVNQGLTPTGAETYAVTGANADLAEVAAVTDLRYNSDTKGWGTNSTIKGNSYGWIPVNFSSASNEKFKIYHDGWGDAYFAKSSAAVSLNTVYTLNNTGSNPNMTYSFAAGNYGIKIENPDAINNMRMTIYRLFDAGDVYYLDTSDYWSDDDPEIGAYFCDSTTNEAVWVLATRCGDIDNNHLYRVVVPTDSTYSKLVWGRFHKGTTTTEMSLSDSNTKFWNQTVDCYDQATNTCFKLTSYGSGTTTKATVSTSTISHSHSYYAYEYTRSTSSDSYSLVKTVTSGTSVGCATGTIYLSATDRSDSGYDFDGWYRGTTSGVNNATTLVSSNLTCTPTNYSGTSYYYAKYTLSTFTITYNDGSGSPVTAGKISGSVSNGTKVYDVDYTISSSKYTRDGYTQVGWATTKNYTRTSGNGTTDYYALGANYADNNDLTLYPVWELNAPKNAAETGKPTISGGTIVAGQTFDIDPSMNDCPADATRSYSYTITRGGNDATSYASIGTDSSNAATYHVFSTSTPGAYSVTWTVTDTNEDNGVVNANYKASATTDSVTINVLPVSPILQWTIFGTTGRDDTHDGTSEYPFMIMLGNQYYCTVTVTNANANYTYTWYTDSEFTQQLGTGTSITFNGDYVTSTTAGYAPSTAEVASDSESTPSFTVYCRASCNGKDNDSLASTVYYIIQPLVEDFHFLPFQKIFGLADSSVSLAAQYNLEAADGYTTELMFSSTNETDSYVVAQTVTSQFMKVFETAIRQFMYPAGPKYFYMRISGTVNDVAVSTVSPKIHTTVGTANSTATRPIYFYNNSGFDLKNYQVICYYIDANGNLGYNAAQDMKKGGSTSDDGLQFRAMIPEGATAVRFGFLNVDPKYSLLHYYGMPTLSEGTISGMSKPIFIGCTTQVALNDTTRRITSAEKTESDGFYTLSCTSSVY